MFCNKCGHQFDGNFCPKCGAKAKNPPETPVNTTVNFTEEKDENPYNVYYSEQVQNSHYQNTYEPQFGYQPPKQEAENVANTQSQQQPVQPPYQPYYPPYYPPQPPKDKKLKWWQILLIVIAGMFLGLVISPVSCVCSMFACDEMYLYDYKPSDTRIDEVCYIDETAVSEYFSYTLSDATEIRKFAGTRPKDGYKFIQVTFDIENISNHSEWISYETSCYVGDSLCHEIYSDEFYYNYGNLHPGKNYQETLVFEVPEDAEQIDIYLNDYYKEINFIIK